MQSQVNTWVEQSRLGNREAFAQIVRQFQSKVSAVTFSITGNLQESEDIAQETFLVA
jgi:RNA polymerase sigma-70 factor (ECF subfamily)